MKLAIFGSTGTIGLQLVKQALEYGHTVTVLVRPRVLETEYQTRQLEGDTR